MKLILGLDEAGYGPNLGPLCLGASLWEVPDHCPVGSLAEQLSPTFLPAPSEKGLFSWIPLGDSKKLYRSTGTIRSLSVGLMALLEFAAPGGRRNLEGVLWDQDFLRIQSQAWYQPNTKDDSASVFVPEIAENLEKGLLAQARDLLGLQKVAVKSIHSRAIDEAEYNSRLDELGNKSTLLSLVTLDWIAQLLNARLPREGISRVEIYCDKHGGRNRYLGPLLQVFPETWFETEIESADCSRYRGKIEGIECVISFTAKGDSILPASVASMAAKWTREVLMHRLNAFWRQHIPDLKSTAGYPVDAKRFAEQIEPIAERLGMTRSQWWRRS